MKKRNSEPYISTYLHSKGRRLGLPIAGNFELTARCNFNCVTFDQNEPTITMEQFYDLGLSGKDNSAYLRDVLSRHFHLGHCNAKTLYKRLCMANITYEEAEEICRRAV